MAYRIWYISMVPLYLWMLSDFGAPLEHTSPRHINTHTHHIENSAKLQEAPS